MSGRRLIAIIVGVVGLLLLVAIAYLLITSDEDTVGDTVEKTVDDVVEVVEDVTQPEEPLPEGTPGVTPSPTIPPEDVMNMVEVVVAWNTVPRGFQMTEAELAIDERLAIEVGSNVITNIDDAIGLHRDGSH